MDCGHLIERTEEKAAAKGRPYAIDGAGVGTSIARPPVFRTALCPGRLGAADQWSALRRGRRFLRRGGGLSPPGGNRSVNENRTANPYHVANSPHDPVLPPAGEDVSAADR